MYTLITMKLRKKVLKNRTYLQYNIVHETGTYLLYVGYIATITFVPEFLCTESEFLSKQMTTIPFITLHMGAHVGLCVSFIHITISTKIAMAKYNSIVLIYMPVQITHRFKKSAAGRFHTK